jgi:type II secretory pathway pseudopilin PulG
MTRSPIQRQSALSAFTLIELLLSIGAAALILGVTQTAFFSALRLRNSVSDAVDNAAPLELALDQIKRDLQCAVPPKASGVLSGGFRVGSISSLGTALPVAIELYTATGSLKAQEPWPDIQRISYGLRTSTEVGNGSQDLYRGVCRNLLPLSTPEVEDQLMLRDVSRIDFECFDGTQWTPYWDTTDTTSVNTNLPVAVRVRIQLGRPGAIRSDAVELLVPIDSQSRTNSTSTAGG